MLNKEQWQSFEQEAERLYHSTKLRCDGFELTVRKEMVGRNRLGLAVYVNGRIKGEWLMAERNCPELRFMRPHERFLYSPKERQRVVKECGKRWSEKSGVNKKYTIYLPWWTSATALRRHLVKHCQQIELVEPEVLH